MNKCVGSQTQELPGWHLKTALHGGQGQIGKGADHSRLVDDTFISKGTYIGGLSCETTRRVDFSTPCWNLNSLYKLASGTFTIQMFSTTHCSLKVSSLKRAPTVGTVGIMSFQRPRRAWGASNCPGHIFSMTFFKEVPNKYLRKCYASFDQTRILYFSAANNFRAKFNITLQ